MSCGTTTNESYKWGIVRAYYKRRAKEAAARKKNMAATALLLQQESGRHGPANSQKRPLEQRPDADFPDEVPLTSTIGAFQELDGRGAAGRD